MTARSLVSSRTLPYRHNTCLDFAAGTNNVSLADTPSLRLTGNYSYAFWCMARSAGDGGAGRVYDHKSDLIFTAATGTGFQFFVNNNAISVVSGKIAEFKELFHVVITYDGANVIFIKNGVVFATVAQTTNPAGESVASYIGNRGDLVRGLNGLVGDFRIYKGRVLSTAEAAALFRREEIDSTNLSAHWKADEGSGSTLNDSSGNSNTGTITGATFSTQIAQILGTNRVPASSRSKIVGYKRGLQLSYNADLLTIPVVPSTTGFCFGFWLKFNASGNNEGFFECTDGSNNDGFRFIRGAGVNIRLLTFQIRNGNVTDAQISVTVPLQKHVYIAGTFIPNSCKLYYGTREIPIAQTGATDTSCAMTTPGGVLTLGKKSGSAGSGSILTVNDFIFKNTVTPWTLQEIQDAAMLRSFPSGLDVHYDFDGNVNDVSGNANNGTLTGGAYSLTDIPMPNRGVV